MLEVASLPGAAQQPSDANLQKSVRSMNQASFLLAHDLPETSLAWDALPGDKHLRSKLHKAIWLLQKQHASYFINKELFGAQSQGCQPKRSFCQGDADRQRQQARMLLMGAICRMRHRSLMFRQLQVYQMPLRLDSGGA